MSNELNFTNRKINYDYIVEDSFLAGMVLTGLQIKAIRHGKLNISESFCRVIDNEVFLFNIILDGQVFNDIKLLLTKKEIKDINKILLLGNRTIVPLNLSVKRMAKMKIGVCKGKKEFDRRETIKTRDVSRQIRDKDYV